MKTVLVINNNVSIISLFAEYAALQGAELEFVNEKPAKPFRTMKEAVEKIFNVHVTKINTQIVPGKWKRVRFRPGLTAERKKAIVTLKEGEKIEFV